MATRLGTWQPRLRSLVAGSGGQRRTHAYRRAALLSAAIAAAVAVLAAVASRTADADSIIFLFQPERWLFWLAGLALAIAAGGLVAWLGPALDLPAAARDEVGLTFRPPATPLVPTRPLLPAVATFGAVLLISVYHSRAMIAVAPALLAPTLLAILVARYHLHDPSGAARRTARTAHVLLTHGVAFLTLATIYINKVRSLLSASTVALVACLLLLQLTDAEHYPAERRFIYGLVGGVILGEVTWALNYWPLTGWTGGALLLIAFYLVAGLILAQTGAGVRRRDLLEYGAVGAIAFAIVTASLW